MLHPTFSELSQNKFNRYELAIATAKCAREVTDEYVRQRENAEKALTGNKETDKPINTMIDQELKDEKAVKIAIDRIYKGEYSIVENMPESPAAESEETSESESEKETGDENPSEETDNH